MARLDRLGPAKEVGQIGAAIGREFSHPLLAAVVRKPEGELVSALDRLIALVCCSGRERRPHANLSVKTRTGAACSLWHSAAGARDGRSTPVSPKRLESKVSPILPNQPELLARSFRGSRIGRTGDKILAHGRREAVRWASNREAIGHSAQALALNEKQAPDVGPFTHRASIYFSLSPALMTVSWLVSTGVGSAFERAEHLARELESSIHDLRPP